MALTEEEIIDQIPQKFALAIEQVHRQIVGQDKAIQLLCTSLLANGHVILIGVPGLAKTMMVNCLASALGLKFARIQFTPDLMPSDITGYDVLQEDRHQGTRVLKFVPGPVFTHLLLADEINRTPPKTQAALLQAMQERQVSVSNKTYPLEPPFQVIATQNPIEQEGTYPLPEALQDRFMLSVVLDYPSLDEELIIAERAGKDAEKIEPVLSREEILQAQKAAAYMPISRELIQKAARFCRATRRDLKEAHPEARKSIQFGAGPRAVQHWIQAAKAYALLQGNTHVKENDLLEALIPSLRHRIVLTLEAEASGTREEDVLQKIAANF